MGVYDTDTWQQLRADQEQRRQEREASKESGNYVKQSDVDITGHEKSKPRVSDEYIQRTANADGPWSLVKGLARYEQKEREKEGTWSYPDDTWWERKQREHENRPKSQWTDYGWYDDNGLFYANRVNGSTGESVFDTRLDYLIPHYLGYEDKTPEQKPDDLAANRPTARDRDDVKSLAEMLHHFGYGYGDYTEAGFDNASDYLSAQLDAIKKQYNIESDEEATKILDQSAIESNVDLILDILGKKRIERRDDWKNYKEAEARGDYDPSYLTPIFTGNLDDMRRDIESAYREKYIPIQSIETPLQVSDYTFDPTEGDYWSYAYDPEDTWWSTRNWPGLTEMTYEHVPDWQLLGPTMPWRNDAYARDYVPPELKPLLAGRERELYGIR